MRPLLEQANDGVPRTASHCQPRSTAPAVRRAHLKFEVCYAKLTSKFFGLPAPSPKCSVSSDSSMLVIDSTEFNATSNYQAIAAKSAQEISRFCNARRADSHWEALTQAGEHACWSSGGWSTWSTVQPLHSLNSGHFKRFSAFCRPATTASDMAQQRRLAAN